MATRNIIVIGASAGGVGPLKAIISALPANLQASVLIVWHMAASAHGVLPDMLNRLEGMHAFNAQDGESLMPGRIYIAPPDHHLLLEPGKIRVTKGPKENRFRPAVDPLFRSAAFTYTNRVIGVILSGALDDGTSGLWAIKDRGGITIVQDPAEADVPGMPANAMREVDIDYCVPVVAIAPLLVKLCSEDITANPVLAIRGDERIKKEISIAAQDPAVQHEIIQMGELTPYTCPECHGVLSKIREGNLLRYRCHTGHAFSADTLLAELTAGIEDGIWNAIRAIEESIMLINHIGDDFAEKNEPKLAALYFQKAKDAEQRRQLLKKAVLDHEQLDADTINESMNDKLSIN
jgi:two-component system chemotaxis response regulator CheB